MKIETEQNIPGYNAEFWGYTVTRNDITVSGAGYIDQDDALEAAKERATEILTEEGWDEEEIEEEIEEAVK
jgi:hypothetical protein